MVSRLSRQIEATRHPTRLPSLDWKLADEQESIRRNDRRAIAFVPDRQRRPARVYLYPHSLHNIPQRLKRRPRLLFESFIRGRTRCNNGRLNRNQVLFPVPGPGKKNAVVFRGHRTAYKPWQNPRLFSVRAIHRPSIELKYGDHRIEWAKQVKYLGYVFTPKLGFGAMIKHAKRKIRHRVAIVATCTGRGSCSPERIRQMAKVFSRKES